MSCWEKEKNKQKKTSGKQVKWKDNKKKDNLDNLQIIDNHQEIKTGLLHPETETNNQAEMLQDNQAETKEDSQQLSNPIMNKYKWIILIKL